MGTKKAKNVNEMNMEVMKKRLTAMIEMKNEICEHSEDYHVKLQKGNTKTGEKSMTVSLIPVVDCPNCSECKKKCYDLRNDCCYPSVQKSRAINSAIHDITPGRYWAEIEQSVIEEQCEFLRINVGGDMSDNDFYYLNDIAKRCPNCTFLFFTKNYKGINKFLDEVGSFEKNVKRMMSAWPGMEMDNPYNLPCAHVMWADGSTTAPQWGAILCRGNCSECYMDHDGCVGVVDGGHVVMNAH